MSLSELKVLIIDDSVYKAMDITRAMEFSGVSDITRVRDQESAFEALYESIENKAPFSLIVTDMHYPLATGMEADYDAGFILIERLRKKRINIPVIICSSRNYDEPGILGTVWYNKSCDLSRAFQDLLYKLVEV
uniref:hypothetical protein n=1 Tax=Acetatifactor sp. TaxID=1872090 RepID=UPI0040569EFE